MAVLVRPNGRIGLHGRDHALPAPDRLPADDGTSNGTGADRLIRPRRRSTRAAGWIVLYDDDCASARPLALVSADRAGAPARRAAADRGRRAAGRAHPEQRMASWHLISWPASALGGAALAPLLRSPPAGQLPAAGPAHVPGSPNAAIGGWQSTARASRFALERQAARRCVSTRASDRREMPYACEIAAALTRTIVCLRRSRTRTDPLTTRVSVPALPRSPTLCRARRRRWRRGCCTCRLSEAHSLRAKVRRRFAVTARPW